MKKLFIFIFLTLALNGCFKNPIKTGAISEENRINLSSLSIGMTQEQVLDVMGYPYKIEEKIEQNKIYEIWYYITEPTLLGQSKLISRNFTPLVFESGHLRGWGNNFYKYTFDLEDERHKRKEEKRQRYTDDKEEWPRNKHTIIPPLNETKIEHEHPSEKKDSDEKKVDDQKLDQPSTDEKMKECETKPFFQKKPDCCIKKQKKSKVSKKLDSSKKTDENADKKMNEDIDRSKGPCKKDRVEDGYHFWE